MNEPEKASTTQAKIKKCSCVSQYQDERYGQGNRVHSYAPRGNNGSPGWRCTICGDVKPI